MINKRRLNNYLCFDAMCSDGKKIWGINYFNELYEVDLSCNELHFLAHMPDYVDGEKINTSMMYHCRNQILFAPFRGGHFWKFDLINGRIEKVLKVNANSMFLSYYLNDNEILFFSKKGDEVVTYNFSTEKVAYKRNLLKSSKAYEEKMLDGGISGSITSYNGFLYFVLYGSRYVLKIDIQKLEVTEILELDGVESLIMVTVMGDKFYYVTHRGEIGVGNEHQVVKMLGMPGDFKCLEEFAPYHRWFKTHDRLILLPCGSNMVLCCKDEYVEKVLDIENYSNKFACVGLNPGIMMNESLMLALDTKDYSFVMIDLDTWRVKKQFIEFWPGVNYVKSALEMRGVMEEMGDGTLEAFLDSLKN